MNRKLTINTIFILAVGLGACNSYRIMPSKKIERLSFEQSSSNRELPFVFQSIENSPELADLNKRYALEEVVAESKNELERVLALLAWTNSRWEHSGSNTPSKSNTLTILEEAKTGKKFRCVEYGIVLRSVLTAQGFYARTLGLKTKDVAITKIGAGHVLSEVWLEEYQKWVIVDAQFNVMPVLNNRPLNAVEFQEAIIENKDFQLINSKGVVSDKERKKYLNFIPHYLYYFDFRFDQRENKWEDATKVGDKGYLMLLPIDAKEPTVFQRGDALDYLIHTRSLAEFYASPK